MCERKYLMSNPKYQSLPRINSDNLEEEEGRMSGPVVVSSIPSAQSSQHLMRDDAESVITEEDQKSLRRRNSEIVEHTFSSVTKSQWFTVGVLCFINLINYMDRFTIAGKWQTSLIQTRSTCVECAKKKKYEKKPTWSVLESML